jgi:hypothetical protein
MPTPGAPISVESVDAAGSAEWERFLEHSNNGTLFHDLRFLAYHPPDRFCTRHLVLRQGASVAALVPGGLADIDGNTVFTSPIGASIGGPVVRPRLQLTQAVDLVRALQTHARAEGWAGIEMTIPPSLYHRVPSDTLAFALHFCGFRLTRRWLCHAIPLAATGSERYLTQFRDTAANLVRSGRRGGIAVVEGGLDRLDEFLEVFRDTYTRHGARATHTPEEIADLLARFPVRVRLWLSMLDGTPIAGVLLLKLNAHVAHSFYICMSSAHARHNGNVVVFATLLDQLGDQGYRWLDLGPSAHDGNLNTGVAFFKEGLGALGHCRDRWNWSTENAAAMD